MHDQAAFRTQMRRLAEAGIRAYVAHGNHDPADGWSAGLALPGDRARLPARRRRARRARPRRRGRRGALRPQLPDAQGDRRLRRAASTRRPATRSPSACCTPTSAAARATTTTRPPRPTSSRGPAWTTGRSATSTCPAACWTRRAPSTPARPQGLQPNEDGPRGCYLVEADARGVEERFVETASVRWARRRVDVDGPRRRSTSCTDALSDACDELRARGRGAAGHRAARR